MAASMSAAKKTLLIATTASKLASAKGSSSRSPSRNSAAGSRSRATASSAGEASKPVTVAPRRLASTAARPAPQPASSKRVPRVTWAASRAAPISGSVTCSASSAKSRARPPQSFPWTVELPMCTTRFYGARLPPFRQKGQRSWWISLVASRPPSTARSPSKRRSPRPSSELLSILAAPDGAVIPTVAIAALVALVVLGVVGARAGGADPWRGALRVSFWGALAMAATAAIGTLFDVAEECST